MSLPQEDIVEIQNFVSVILKHWYGLQAAICNGMGGSPRETNAKIEEMTHVLTSLCCKSDVDEDELINTLEDLTDTYFNTWFEDGSVHEVACGLWNQSRNWHLGNKDSLRLYVNSKTKLKLPECPKLDGSESDEDEDKTLSNPAITGNIDKSTEKMDTDESSDGWEIPKYVRRKNR